MPPILGKRLGAKQELAVSAGVMLFGVVLWYLILYQPVTSRTSELKAQVDSQEDSLEAVRKYKLNVAALQLKINDLEKQTKEWDGRFPERTEIVSLATQILNFSSKHNLELIEMKPSLYELYALEKAGAHMSGRYVMQLPITTRFQGRFLDLGKMLEDITTLPFNMTIADVSLSSAPKHYPMLDIKLRLFLYVHL